MLVVKAYILVLFVALDTILDTSNELEVSFWPEPGGWIGLCAPTVSAYVVHPE